MAKTYSIKNKFQLIQMSLVDPEGNPASRIFRKGLNENIPEWMLEHPDIKHMIKEGNFSVVERKEPEKKFTLEDTPKIIRKKSEN